MKKIISNFLRLLITSALLAYVCYKAGLFNPADREKLIRLLSSVNIHLLIISVVLGVIMNFSSVIKWHMLLRSRGIRVGIFRLYVFYMIGRFFNQILPTSVGGDVMRIHELGKHTGKTSEAIASVFVDRFSGIVTLVVLSFVAMLTNFHVFNIPLVTVSLAATIVVIAVVGWLVIANKPFEFVMGLTGRNIGLLNRVLSKIEKIHNSVMDYKTDRSALWVAVINSLIFYFLSVVNVWVSALAFGADIDASGMIVAVPLIFLIMNLPISFGGIGLMEFAYAFTFDLIGYSIALGVSTALLMRAKVFFDMGLGGILYAVTNRGKSLKKIVSEKQEILDEQ